MFCKLYRHAVRHCGMPHHPLWNHRNAFINCRLHRSKARYVIAKQQPTVAACSERQQCARRNTNFVQRLRRVVIRGDQTHHHAGRHTCIMLGLLRCGLGRRGRATSPCSARARAQLLSEKTVQFQSKNNVTMLPTCALYTQYSPSLRVVLDGISPASSPLQEGWRTRPRDKEEEGTPTRQAAGRQLLLYPFMGRPHGHRHQCRCPKHSPARGCRCEVRFAWPSPHPRWSSHAAAPPQWSEGPPARPRG